MSIIRKIFLLLCFSLFITSCSMILNFKDLPDPNGSYYIGTETFTWEDSFRDEWFTKDKIDNRKIVVQIWYPASEPSDSLFPYMDYANLRVESISKRIDKGKGYVKPVTKVKTNTYLKANPTKEKFPLILFSHGLGGYKTQNLINIENLVSKGYIVVAPDHTYDATITIFDDGTSVGFESGLPDNISEKEFWENRLPQINTRSADMSFIIDKLQTLKKHNLYDSIDFNKIGIFGHSFGGATSVVSSWNDTRISACLNLDGWFVPIIDEIINTGLKIPFCYIGQENWENTPLNYPKLDNFYKNCSDDTYILKVKGTHHFDYSDMPYFSSIGRMIASGKSVDKHFTIRLSNLISGFFDEYLKEKPDNWTLNIIDYYDTIVKFK